MPSPAQVETCMVNVQYRFFNAQNVDVDNYCLGTIGSCSGRNMSIIVVLAMLKICVENYVQGTIGSLDYTPEERKTLARR